MAQYRLLVPHTTTDGVYLDAGTIVGDDTPWPWPDHLVTSSMEPVDDAAKKVVETRFKEAYGGVPARTTLLDSEVTKEQDFGKGEPVSDQQRLERDKDYVEPRHHVVSVPPKGGQPPPAISIPEKTVTGAAPPPGFKEEKK